jgi:hypothetical protein
VLPVACSCAGYVEPLDDDVEIVVPEDDHGLYAIDILDPSWVSSRVFVQWKIKNVISLVGVLKKVVFSWFLSMVYSFFETRGLGYLE